MSENTFLWHDYETFGANPRVDRPCQFAALRTNEALEPIEAPTLFYCQPSIDTLPQPMACMITGITPQYAHSHGQPEPKFAQQIFDIMSRPGTCVVGYNNIRFDDEVTRHLFWRNFLDPYSREYANGNSRFDLINVLRLTRALRPEGLMWPDYENGQPSFRLEDIAKANGLSIESAHDALVDVENTLAVAQLVLKKQPKLWAWALKLRDKRMVDELLAPKEPLIFASSRFAKRPGSVSVILPMGRHPNLSNQWLCWDLLVDPADWLGHSVDQVHASLGQRSDEEAHEPVLSPLVSVKINQIPMLAPLNVADQSTCARLALDVVRITDHQRQLEQHPDWAQRLVVATAQLDRAQPEHTDPEADLYGGFVQRPDQGLLRRVPSLEGPQLAGLSDPFSDARLNALLLRYRARHYPESLDETEREQWQADCHHRLIEGAPGAGPTVSEYLQSLKNFAAEYPEQTALAHELEAWLHRPEFPLRAAT